MELEGEKTESMGVVNLDESDLLKGYVKIFKTKSGWMLRFMHNPKNRHHIRMSTEAMDNFIKTIIGMKELDDQA